MSFEKTRVALGADLARAVGAAYSDATGLIAKFVVLNDDSLVSFILQGQADADKANRADFKFMLQRDDDATPAFAALADTGVAGNTSQTVIAATASTMMPVFTRQTRKLAAGRYTVKLQIAATDATAAITLNGTAANGAPFEMCVEVETNDALTSAGQDSRHVAGQF